MSTSRPKVNLRSTAVKRIMQEASELSNANIDEDGFVAAPLEDDIFEWHCTMRGVSGSEYDGGLYHLRIILPSSYPMSAPDIMLMTPNGRFELGKKICIDGLTSFHAGSWQPAWGVRTAVVGLRSFWMQNGEAVSAIGALDYSKDERRRLARLSKDWKCPQCSLRNCESIPPSTTGLSASGSGSGGVKPKEEGNGKIQEPRHEPDRHTHSQDQSKLEKDDQKEENHDQKENNADIQGSDISMNPNPQELPSILPPSTATLPSSINPSGSTSSIQALPINIIPPSLEETPASLAVPTPNDENRLSPPASPVMQPEASFVPSSSTNEVLDQDVSSTSETNPPTIRARSSNQTDPDENTQTRTQIQRQPAPTPTPTSSQRSPKLYLIDSLIVVLVLILSGLIARRMA